MVAGGRQTCGLRLDGSIECWGADYGLQSVEGFWQFNSVPDGEHTAVAAGASHACSLSVEGYPQCWPAEFHGRDSMVLRWPGEVLRDISVGSDYACGLRADRSIFCWGDKLAVGVDAPVMDPLDGQFTAISAGRTHACALRIDGTVACWGLGSDGRTVAPEGQFRSVSAGSNHSCGLRVDGTVACWGSDDPKGRLDAPDGQFAAVDAGASHSCGLRGDGTIECWGVMQAPPDGVFFSR